MLFFDTSYKKELQLAQKKLVLSEDLDAYVGEAGIKSAIGKKLGIDTSTLKSHPLLETSTLVANPHYIALARSLFS